MGFLPLPNASQEILAAHVLAGLLFFRIEPLFHHRLGGDARMVRARDPEGLKTQLAAMAHHHILDRPVEGVPHVQDPRHVGRGNHDRKGLCVGGALLWGSESARSLPAIVEVNLDLAGLKTGG